MKKIICISFLLLSTCFATEEVLTPPDTKLSEEVHKVVKGYEVVQDQSGLVITTADLAKREIRKLRLENGLSVILISDPETHQSGAALAVSVGSWDDPQDRPGMAHFVEHLLFLGTEKYPEEEGYTRYLDEHGGERNAFTMSDRTVYMFSANNGGFLGALDRFGQFFISPLFTPSGVERECKAIHQEYCKNLPLDPWRMLYVKKELANVKHPFHSFCIGNRDTLNDISQDELKAWYASHYSADLMHLTVFSSLDLDTLEKEVVSLFSLVKNQQKKPSHYTESLTVAEIEPKLCIIKPIQELQLLELTWEIPRFYGNDRSIHADKLLSHVLGHEGSTSLLAQLKRENLAESLSMSNYRVGKDQCLLSLTVHLTTKGVQDYEKVIQRCFEGIASVQQSGIPRYVFDEVCQLGEMRYRFQSREAVFDFVTDYVTYMVDEPLETYPRQTLLPSTYAPEKVRELLSYLTPQACQYTLAADTKLTKIKTTVKEKWLGVDYTLVPISTKKIAEWSCVNCHKAICIPRPNPYLPENMTIKSLSSKEAPTLPKPTLIGDEPLGKIYSAEDTQFLIPEVYWSFTIKTPEIADTNPLSHVYADLYCHTVSELLNSTSYEALVAGLSFSLEPKHGALELKVKGYSDKATSFLNTIVTVMKTACPTEAQFKLYTDLIARDYANGLNASPVKQGNEVLSGILYKDFSGVEKKNKALKSATYKQMSSFCQNVLKTTYVEGMLYGNTTQEEAKEVWKSIKQTLASQSYPPARHPKIELATLPSLERPSYLVVKSQQPAHALILTTDCGTFTFKRRAAQEILMKGLDEPFFSELRTRQQTAYLVANWSQELERHLYSFFAIQSSSHNTRDLLARFELFIESSLQHLTDDVIPQERFESIRTAQIHQLQHPADSFLKMGTLLNSIAFQYDGDFEWLDKRIASFEELTYEEFTDYAKEFLGKENTRRLAICVDGSFSQKGNISYQRIKSTEKLRSAISYEGRDLLKLTEREKE